MVAIALCAAAAPASARVDCVAVSRIERVHATLLRLKSQRGANTLTANVTLLDADLATLSLREVDRALGPHVDAISRERILTFIAEAQRLRPLIAKGQGTQVAAAVQSINWVQTLKDADRAFGELPCGPQAIDGMQNNEGRRVVTDELTDLAPAQPLFVVKNLAQKILFVISAAVAAGGATYFLAPVIKRRKLLQRRRAKRFAIKYYTHVGFSGGRMKVKVLNLSCTGAKVQYREDRQLRLGQRLLLSLEDQKVDATVVWTNTLYFGLKFAQPTPIALVRRLAKTYQFSGANHFGATR